MLRTSYSQILNSSRDFSLAICDTRGRLIAQADHLPVHVGALPWATLAVEERFKDVKPGDVFLLNDPYFGGSHLPDLTAFVPVFDGEKRLPLDHRSRPSKRWSVAPPTALTTPARRRSGRRACGFPDRLSEAGRPREDILDMLALNVRNPREFSRRSRRDAGAAHLGERRVAKTVPGIWCAGGRGRHRGDPRCDRAADPCVVSTWTDGVFHGEGPSRR